MSPTINGPTNELDCRFRFRFFFLEDRGQQGKKGNRVKRYLVRDGKQAIPAFNINDVPPTKKKREDRNVPSRFFPRRDELCIKRPGVALESPVRETCSAPHVASVLSTQRSAHIIISSSTHTQTHRNTPRAQTSLLGSSTPPHASVSQTARNRGTHRQGCRRRGARGVRAHSGWTSQNDVGGQERRGNRGSRRRV